MAQDFTGSAQKRVGSIIAGKYQLNRVLGVGGMGAVYEALHMFTNRTVAVKLLHEDFAVLPAVARRFLQEAKATIDLKHPSIIEVLDAGQEADGKLYVVFEMLEGSSFSAALRSAEVGYEELLNLFAHLFDALQVAHENGIVHRDIKPENVFLVEGEDFPGRVKLLDFGIARRVTGKVGDGITQVGAVLGTPLYMSPEVMMGEAVDPHADLWSMGVMMYRAFAARLPFQGDTPEALLKMIVMRRGDRLKKVAPDLPDELTEIIEKALQVDRKRRWQSAIEVAQAIRVFAPFVGAPAMVAKSMTAANRVTALPPRPNIPLPTPNAMDSQEWKPTQKGDSQYAWESALKEIEGEIEALEDEVEEPFPELTAPPEPEKPKGWLSKIFKRKD